GFFMPEERTAPHAISLVLRDNGWRIYLTPNGNEDGYPVSIKEAEELARAATEILSTSVLITDDKSATPFMVVRNGTNVLRQMLQRELEVAEARAASIPHL